MKPEWTPYVIMACTALIGVVQGFIFFRLDARYVQKTDAAKESDRLDELAESRAQSVRVDAMAAIKILDEAFKAQRVEYAASNTSLNAKLDGIISSRGIHDQQLQSTLTNITGALGELKGRMDTMISMSSKPIV